jgi:hypothetical protein
MSQIKAGPLDFQFNSRYGGFVLNYEGVSIIKEADFWIVNSDWTQHYYKFSLEGEVTVETQGDKQIMRIPHENKVFKGEHLISATENELEIQLKYQLVQDLDDVVMESCLGYFSASVIAGCPFKAEMIDGTTLEGIIPQTALYPDNERSMLAPKPLRRLKIKSRIGQITIEVSGEPDGITVIDSRKNPIEWARKYPIFWAGVMETKLKPFEEKMQTIRIRFEPISKSTQKEIAPKGTPEVEESAELRMPPAPSVVVIPEPKEMVLLDNDFVLTPETKIVVAEKADAADFYGAKSFANEIKTRYQLDLEIVRENQIQQTENVILIGEATKNKMAAKVSASLEMKAPEQEEGYSLAVTAAQVVVLGADQRGSYYGMQTLKQLVKASAEQLSIQGCRINDYPTLKFRGALVFFGKEALPFHKKLVDRILARYKYNHLIIADGDVEWKSVPELITERCMPQKDVKELVQYAKEHFIGVSPLIHSLGYSPWMFANGQNRDLAEDPNRPYGCCPSNPKSHEFLFKIYDEALELFEPEYFHIGHDEVTYTEEFPKDPICKQKTAGQLITDDIIKLHDYLTARGVKVMIWSDMFLTRGDSPDACNAPSPEEAAWRRSVLPKDIIITDWHYAVAEADAYRSTPIFQNDGFKTIVCPWNAPGNIANFAEMGKKNNAYGMLQTLWVGFNHHEGKLTEFFDQYTAFVLGGDYAWNSGGVAPEKLPYRADEEFKKQWEQTAPERSPRKGFTIDLNSIYNLNLSNDFDSNFNPGESLERIPFGFTRLKNDRYHFAETTEELSGVRLACSIDSKLKFSDQIEIPIHQTAGTLMFIHTSAWPEAPGKNIGSYRINYEDGSQECIELIYAGNIASWTDERTCVNGPTIWSGETKSGQKIALRRLEWKNPNPDKTIKSIQFIGTGSEAGPILLAVSGIA